MTKQEKTGGRRGWFCVFFFSIAGAPPFASFFDCFFFSRFLARVALLAKKKRRGAAVIAKGRRRQGNKTLLSVFSSIWRPPREPRAHPAAPLAPAPRRPRTTRSPPPAAGGRAPPVSVANRRHTPRARDAAMPRTVAPAAQPPAGPVTRSAAAAACEPTAGKRRSGSGEEEVRRGDAGRILFSIRATTRLPARCAPPLFPLVPPRSPATRSPALILKLIPPNTA